MRARRGLLFWGLFLIPLGGVSLLVRAGVLDADRLADAWRLWPIILIGMGLAIVLGRSRTAVVGTTIVALVLGTLGGAALASGHLWLGALSDCAVAGGRTDQQLQRTGTFDESAALRLELQCGSATVTSAAGNDWRLDAAYRGSAPFIDASANRLDIRVPGGSGDRRNVWTISVPARSIGSVSVTANAATATLAFPDTHLASLDARMNAGDLRVDVTRGAIDEIDVSMNAGRIRLDSGSAALGGDVSLSAGAFDLCVPDGVGLRLNVTDQLTFVHNLAARGLVRSGNTWTRNASDSAATIALSVDGSAANFSLDPDGGCR